ncbi:competence protein CoiA family protein [Alicyclobacillus mengziensis]|uniref:Competence protein CoiA-like N-terminal domain-containing protein n=1 Tax=Alicyclobacillus mengziensis TaxID=2931921 RepID=A0A9X7VX55_9BACL|nr:MULTISPECIES: hypothetical protein [Alicyclobacillus]MCF8568209.1 hypothetical protein [Alicyclobacillus tolerans]QSO46678.1 hypothetical protein JZ786_19890 [Alicyclobacillus mengziensis]
MRWALDTSRGNIDVDASSPSTLRKKAYICPTCGAPVVLHKGTKIEPYFRHASGQANPLCDLYTPGVSVAGHSAQALKHLYRQVGLYLTVIESGSKPHQWNLELGIPEPDCTRGKLKFPFSLGGQRILPVNSIPTGGRRITVIPRLSDYSIVVEGTDDSEWCRRMRQPIPGLNDATINVFGYSSSGGRRIPDQNSIFWGETYSLLWSLRAVPDWWPADLKVSLLQGQNGMWFGAVVGMPAEHSKDVESWVNSILNRRVEYSPAEIQLVSPVSERRLPDGSLVVAPNEEVIISIVRAKGAREWLTLNVMGPELNIQKVNRRDYNTSIFSLGKWTPGRTDLWLDNNIDTALNLVCLYTDIREVHFPGVQLRGKNVIVDEEGNKTLSVSLHDTTSATAFLSKVRKGEVEIYEVDISKRIIMRFSWSTEYRNSGWENTVYMSADQSFDDKSSLVTLLNKVLQRPHHTILLDAGGFGRIELEGGVVFTQPKLFMASSWRKRANWILRSSTTSYTKPNGMWLQIIQSKNFPLLDKYDQELIRQLATRRVPIWLEAHVRAAFFESNRVLVDNKHTRGHSND